MGSISYSCLAFPGGKAQYPTLQRWNCLFVLMLEGRCQSGEAGI